MTIFPGKKANQEAPPTMADSDIASTGKRAVVKPQDSVMRLCGVWGNGRKWGMAQGKWGQLSTFALAMHTEMKQTHSTETKLSCTEQKCQQMCSADRNLLAFLTYAVIFQTIAGTLTDY